MKRLRTFRLRFGLALLGVLLSAAAPAATLLVLGDSLGAGYGLDAGAGWVALLQQRLKAADQPALRDWTVVNASVSGDTTAGGVARLPEALQRFHPQVVAIELGGNDGLRGQSLDAMRDNLRKLIGLARGAGARPLLFEMRIPSNYGPVYTQRFTQVFDELAKQTKTPLVPFFLSAIATDPARWFQDDGIHPNAAAQPQLVDAVWPSLEPLLLHP